MMTTSTKQPTVHHRCGVAPAGEVAEAERRLPLTYFDMFWMFFHPTKRLLFYPHPCSVTHFRETIIPNLKHSLSLTLSHYFPLAGNFLYPLDSDSGPPELRYVPGDSVAMTFAESGGALDFISMTGNQPRDADDFHYLVPDLAEPRVDSDSGFKMFPLLAVQITLFPEIGISIGITNHHVAGDANSIVGFIKAWSSASKLGRFDETRALPFHDRSVIKDPSGRAGIYWNQMKAFKNVGLPSNLPTNRVRATFVLQSKDIEKLKNRAAASGSIHLSSFTVTMAYVWSCFSKSTAEEIEDENTPEFLGFPADARSRLDPPAPAAYLGNCLGFVVTESTNGKMKGEEGFIGAAKLIGDLIGKKVNKKGELMRDADEWLVKFGPLIGQRCYGVAGSPKFDLYETDFGWGNPKKFEAVSIDEGSYSVSLCSSREFHGGLEIGVSLPYKLMDAFQTHFAHGLNI